VHRLPDWRDHLQHSIWGYSITAANNVLPKVAVLAENHRKCGGLRIRVKDVDRAQSEIMPINNSRSFQLFCKFRFKRDKAVVVRQRTGRELQNHLMVHCLRVSGILPEIPIGETSP
jgi:hypothetical protein